MLRVGLDFSFALHQAGTGMLGGEQFGQDLLLGVAPVLLAKGLADGQPPPGREHRAGAFLDGAGDAQVDVRDGGARPRIDVQPQRFAFSRRLEYRREVTFGREDLPQHGLQAAGSSRFLRDIPFEQPDDSGRPVQLDRTGRDRCGEREQQRGQVPAIILEVIIPEVHGHHCILSGQYEAHATPLARRSA